MSEATSMVEVFKNEKFGEIRTLNIEGEPWFVGKDITDVLSYTSPTRAMQDHVDPEDMTFNESLKLSRQSGAWLINESGLYSLILSSKLPTAKQFKRWVTSEVLPAIRKAGSYNIVQKPDSYTLEDPAERAKRWIEEETERVQLRQKVEADAPKVLFANAVEASKVSMLIGDLAKLLRRNGYKTNQKRLLEALRDDGFLGKSGKSLNQPTQRSVEMGLFDIKESVHVQQDESVLVVKTVKVTGKGQIYFLNKYLGANKALGGKPIKGTKSHFGKEKK